MHNTNHSSSNAAAAAAACAAAGNAAATATAAGAAAGAAAGNAAAGNAATAPTIRFHHLRLPQISCSEGKAVQVAAMFLGGAGWGGLGGG